MSKPAVWGAVAGICLIVGGALAQSGSSPEAETGSTPEASEGGQSTLDAVRSAGRLRCGVNAGLVGFAVQDANGNWSGFDVAICQAIAAAVLGDAQAVDFVATSVDDRFARLTQGDIDVLSRNTTWTYSHDTGEGLDFAGVSYYDGQGFLVPREMGLTSAKDLAEASVCIHNGTTTEVNVSDFFRTNNMSFTPVMVDTPAAAQEAYLARECDAYSTDASGLAATRAAFEDPSAHVVLPEIISKEPLGPLVRQGDDEWADLVRWVLNALIAAEEYGVTSANVEELAAGPVDNPEVNRLLGTEGDLSRTLDLDSDWAARAIAAVGNYGEIFERNIGETTPIGLSRGLNAQWVNGGLLYAQPFR